MHSCITYTLWRHLLSAYLKWLVYTCSTFLRASCTNACMHTHQSLLSTSSHQLNEDGFIQSIPWHQNYNKPTRPLCGVILLLCSSVPSPCISLLPLDKTAIRPKSEKGKKFVTFPNKTLTRQKNYGINHLTFQYCITLSAENQGGH